MAALTQSQIDQLAKKLNEDYQTLLREVREDTVAVENVTQGMVLCGVLQPSATPRPGVTPTP